jgi:general secretion pathway protein A
VPEFLLTLCEELGIPMHGSASGSVKALVDALSAHLLAAHAAGRRVAVIIDEAHLLERDVLEQVRLLTNLETSTRKLLQVILIGQPELRELLAREDLRQVAQRITGRHHLEPLSREETAAYVRHRLRVAGATREIFTPAALRELHRRSGGLPRLVNVIADRALLGAFARDRHEVSSGLLRAAAAEVAGEVDGSPVWPWVATAATVLLVAVSVWWVWSQRTMGG